MSGGPNTFHSRLGVIFLDSCFVLGYGVFSVDQRLRGGESCMSISLGECGSAMVMKRGCLFYKCVFVRVNSGDGRLWISFSVVVCDIV